MALENPFARDENGKIKNLTHIMQACQVAPTRARQWCEEAGEDPRAWFPENPK